jgi:LCP family protein required for cell wall assembly
MKHKKSIGRRIFGILAGTVLGLLAAIVLCVFFYGRHLLNQINYVDKEDQAYLSSEEVSAYMETTVPEDIDPALETLVDEELDWGEPMEPFVLQENTINILLIGQDSRSTTGRSLSDVMILVTVDKSAKTITLTSIMRDLYVQIPEYGNSKLNHTYGWGGFDLLNKTLENNFGIRVEGNLEVNFYRFAQLIDLLGGVDIELRADEAAWINSAVGYNGVGAGMQHLNGQQALAYSRIRSLDSDADFSRTARQRKVLTSLFNKFRQSDVETLMNLMEEALPMLTTDMSQLKLVSLAAEVLPILPECTLVSQRIPADGAYYCATAQGMSVIMADMDAARELIAKTMYPES